MSLTDFILNVEEVYPISGRP